DLGELVKYFEEGMSFEAVDSLVNNVVSLDDASAEGEVAEFFNANNFNSAQIYMILNYMYDTLTKKYTGKSKLLALVMKLIKQFENQESAYLFEFFSILRQPQLKANTALINGMALVNSGNAAVASVKSMLGFIHDSLNGSFENIVSTCMKNRAHILKRLSGEKISFEQKSELAEYLRFEKTLIALHSTYMLAKRWRDDQKRKKPTWKNANDEDEEDEYNNEPQNKLQSRINKLKRKRQNGTKMELEVKKNKEEAKDPKAPEIMLELIEDDHKLVSSLSGFAESGNVSEMSVINLCKQIINGNSKIFTIGFLNRLIYFYSKLPSLIYGYSEAQQEKIVHGLRNCVSQASAREKNNAKVTFSFLKKRDDEQTVKYTV
nr:hypothetical protein [Burkholderiales bacterium]